MNPRPVLVVALALLAGLFAAACSVPTSDSPTVIAQDDLDESLRQDPSTTEPETTGAPRDVEYFLLVPNPDDQTQRWVQQVKAEVIEPDPDNPTIVPLVQPLFADDFLTTNGFEDFINVVPTEFELAGVRQNDDDHPYHTVLLTTRDPENPPGEQVQRDAFAQLVWTLTALDVVTAVRFEVDGQLRAVPTSEAELPVDGPVDRDDYAAYDRETIPTTTTSSTTSSTTTTTVISSSSSSTTTSGG